MELRFDAMLCSNLSNGKFDAGHVKCSRDPQVPQSPPLILNKLAHVRPTQSTQSVKIVLCLGKRSHNLFSTRLYSKGKKYSSPQFNTTVI